MCEVPASVKEHRSKSYGSATAESYVTGDEAPAHDVVYAVVCGADVEPSFDGIIDSLVPLPVE